MDPATQGALPHGRPHWAQSITGRRSVRAACAGDGGELPVQPAVLPRAVTACLPRLASVSGSRHGFLLCSVFLWQDWHTRTFHDAEVSQGSKSACGGPRPSTCPCPFAACELMSPDFSFSPSKQQPVREGTQQAGEVREEEAGFQRSMEPDAGLDFRDLGSRPEAKADA